MYSRRRQDLTVRVVSTPFAEFTGQPEPKSGGISPVLKPAFIIPPSHPGLASRLDQPGVLAVTTGQQPGLFTGPLYTIYKALSAAALAHRLAQQWNRPVQAIFWIASDDHDFAEANHVSWSAQDGSLTTLTLRTRPPEGPLTPMYREPLGPDIEAALARLEGELPGTDAKPDVVAWLKRHYRPDATVASSFGNALAELLAPYGVLCLDSAHTAVKRHAAPVLVKALEQSSALDQALAAESRRLVDAGQDPGVPVGDGATLVLVEAKLGRDRLVRNGDHFVTRRSHESFTLEQLRNLAFTEPQLLSPNVLLRPVVESAVLPTVCYVGGPGELRYLALTRPVYQSLGVPRQLPVPRWSGILVEPRVDRVLEKFGAELVELLEPAARLEARVLRDQLPGDAVEALETLRRAISEGYARLEKVAVEIDPTLGKPLQNARQHALSESEAVEKRLIHHMKRRQETELDQIARARTAVLPDGKPQERGYGVIGYLARFGPGVLDLVAESIATWYATTLEAARATA